MRRYTPGGIAEWDDADELALVEHRALMAQPTLAQQVLERIRDEVTDDELYNDVIVALGELIHLGYSIEDADIIRNARFLVDYKARKRKAQADRGLGSEPAQPEITGERVYYIQIRDTIKIGYTAGSVVARCKALAGDRVLAVEPGDRHLEAHRHRQFASYRVPIPGTRERFHPSSELMDHVLQVRQDWADLQVR